MPIRIVRLGSPRAAGEGLRLGTVRRPPRGVPKSEQASRDFYDLWLPDLAPSAELVAFAQSKEWTASHWSSFVRRYRREMAAPSAQRLIALLAALSHQTNLSAGCYCEDATRCHRASLAELFREAGADVTISGGEAS